MADRILTWKPYGKTAKGGRWCKKLEGKRHYFGTAKSKSDRDAYNAAVEAYRKFLDDKANEEFASLSRYDQFVILTKRAAPALRAAYEERMKRAQGDRQTKVVDVAPIVQEFLDEQQRRYELTTKQPEALPANKRLRGSSYKSVQDRLKPFAAWCKKNSATVNPEDSPGFESTLRRYRRQLDDAVIAEELAPATVSNRVSALRRLVQWMWEHRYINDKPRGLDDICAKYASRSTAKSLTPKQIGKLFKHADKRGKAIIAVCLNFGMYPSEAVQLRQKHIREGHVATRRNKTGVPGKWLMWDVTKTLINETSTADKPNDLLWETRQGYPLIHLSGHTRTDSLQKHWDAIRKKSKLKDFKPSNLRDTSATFIEGYGKKTGNLSLVSQHLAHADQRTAKWYIDRNLEPHDLDTTALDTAIKAMGEHFKKALVLDDAPAEKSETKG